jgi:hypothetical protein
MNSTTKKSIHWTSSVAVFCALFALHPLKATAATLSDGWNYAIDSFNDGVTETQFGGGAFEFYGMAINETSDKVSIAINSNLSLAGYADSAAARGNINYGDLFFNFSGQNFNTASATNSLFAVRFADGNDSGVETTGVYKDVTAKSVTQTNSGFSNLNQYNTLVASQGKTPSLGDLDATDPYFEQTGNNTILNSIATGTKVGDIEFLTAATLSALGLNFAQFNAVGSQTIGFSFNKSLLPAAEYIANFIAECANDAIAIKAKFQPQPVPAPANVEPVPAPANVEPEPAPANVEPVPAPANVEPEPAPANVEPEPAPANVEPEPAPGKVEPVPAPGKVQPVPDPANVERVPEPSTWVGTFVGLSFLGIGAAKRKMKRKKIS